MLVKANPCISADDIPNQQKDLEMVTEQTPFTTSSDSSSEYIRGESQIGQGNGISMNEDLSHQSWLEEAKGTLRMVLNKRMFYHVIVEIPLQPSGPPGRYKCPKYRGVSLFSD